MKKITVSILTTLLMLSMVFSSSVFAANEKVSAWDSFLGLSGVKATETSDVGVEYRGHVENKGDFPLDGSWIQGPNRLGTVGEGLRLEAFWIKLAEDAPEGLHIKYEVHVQNKGWMAPVEDGKLAGTQAEGLRIEAIKISLVDDEGNVSGDYSVTYKGHIQNEGDTDWIKSGLQLGTTGSGLRLEALEVKIEKIAPDLSDYEAALAAVTEANYTKASWATYQDVVEDNVMTEDNVQSEVDAATAIILDAQEDLVTVPVIAGMSATAQKTITVTGTELSKLSAAMLTVANNTVVSVTPNADGTSAVVVVGTDLVPDTNVKVTATVDGTAKDYTVKYTIAATTVAIQEATFDNDLAGQAVTVLVNGVATTPSYLASQGYTVTFAAWNSNGTSGTSALFASTSLGTIYVPQSEASKDYTAQVTIAKGATVVTSAKANIKIRDLNNNVSDISAVTLTNMTGTDGKTAATDTFANTSKTLVVNENARISKVVVGYGTAAAELTLYNGYTVESSNSAVVSVNANYGITAVGLGTANLTVTAGKVTYVVPVTVTGTARVATTAVLKDSATQFTYVIGGSTATNTMTVVFKDQYGDPFYKASSAGIKFVNPANFTGTIASNPVQTTGIAATTIKGEATIEYSGLTKAGETGITVFRNSDDTVIGSATIATSNQNVGTTRKLVVTAGSTDNVINTDLTSKNHITFKIDWFNDSNVAVGNVTDLTGYKVTTDASIVKVGSLTASNGVYTLTGGSTFDITGLKAGSTAMLVTAPDGTVIETRTITVQNGEVKITGVSFLTPSTVKYTGSVTYKDILNITPIEGSDDIVTGLTLTPSSVFSVRITEAIVPALTAGTVADVPAGALYLDKDGSGSYTLAGDGKVLGTLTSTVVPGSGSTTFGSSTNVISGQPVTYGNKGNIVYSVTDLITSTNPVVATGNIAVDVPVAPSIGVTGSLAMTQGVTAVTAVTAVKQVETATVAIATAANGTIQAIVTGAGITGSPVTVNIPVLVSDTNNESIAVKVRAALSGNTAISALYDVGGSAGTVTLTQKVAAADDTTLNINLFANSTTIITSAATSANTTTGVAGVTGVTGVTEKGDFTVLTGAAKVGNITVTVNGTAHTVAVAAGDTAAQVATKIATQLTTDTVAGYTVSNATSGVVTLTSTTANTPISPDVTVSIAAN